MSSRQNLIYKAKKHKQLFYAYFVLLILNCSVVALCQTPEAKTNGYMSSQVPRLMKQPSGSGMSNLDIPDYLYKFLSEEDRKELEAYDEYMSYFSEEEVEALEKYNDYFQQLTDSNQKTAEAYDYFQNSWNPVETTVTVPSDELPDFKESFQSFFFNDWVNKPSYSLETEQNAEIVTLNNSDDQKVEITTTLKTDDSELVDKYIISENQEIYQRSVYTEDSEITQITEISGRPQIKLIEPDLSGFDDIQIPIHSSLEAGKGAQEEVKWLSKTIDVKLGFEFDLPGFKYKLDLSLFIIRFRAWAVFEAGFHFVFPVRLIIEYPAEVFEGQLYDFKVTLIPLDLPDYHEFEMGFLLDVGVALDVFCPKLTFKTITIPYWWFWKWRKKSIRIPWPVLTWTNIFHYPIIYYDYQKYNDYTTPLADQKAKIDLDFDLDLLPFIGNLSIPYISGVCDTLSDFMEMGVSLGFLNVQGKAITGKLAAKAGDSPATKNPVSWTHSGEVNSLKFGIPFEAGEFLGIAVDQMIFHAEKVVWWPEFFMNFKDITRPIFGRNVTIPLKSWLGRFSVPILGINFGAMNIPCLYSYEISTSAITSADVYDFSFNVEEITPAGGQGSLATIGTYDQMYEITLQNDAGRSDVIELDVQGLPDGYTATFDRAVPHYSIGSTPTTVNLVISPPEHIKESPGEKTFQILATSQAKRNLNEPDATIIKDTTLTVPVLSDFSLDVDLETELHEVIQVNYGDRVPIGFIGENLGNVNDTISVNTTLYSLDSTIRSWEDSYPVDPYGSGSDHSYSGEVEFIYDKNDLYPLSGVYTLDIEATSQRNPTNMKKKRLALNFTAHYELETTITPQSTTINANFETNFTLSVKNVGNAIDNYTLTSSGWDSHLNFLSGNSILNLAPNENEEVEITLKISDPGAVPSAMYDFRINVFSDGSKGTVFASSSDVSVNVLEPDYVAPGIEYVDTSHSPWDTRYPYSESYTYGPSWKAIDNYPSNYSVYINNTPYVVTQPWQNDTPVFVPVTGTNNLAEGVHNITIEFSDKAGNMATDEIWITITPTDTNIPSCTLISGSILPENFLQPHPIIWNCTEEFILNITLYRNDTKVTVTPDNFKIEQHPEIENTFYTTYYVPAGSLTVGIWNFTLLIEDAERNSVSSSEFLTITPPDNDLPVFTNYPVSSAYLKHGQMISFTATDTYPDKYELGVNSILEQSGSWQSVVPVEFEVDELNLNVGSNELEILLYDMSNNSQTYEWLFTLNDIDPPTLDSPSDFTVSEHNFMLFDAPYWQLHDYDPNIGTYQVYRDSVLVKDGIWTPGNNTISVPLENLTIGIYTFNAEFRDASGNMVPVPSTNVQVTVKDNLAPYIWPHEPIYYEPIYTASWFEFFITEPHLASFKLFRNDTEVDSGLLSTDFPFVFVSIGDLKPGYYNYILEAEDESANIARRLVHLYVTDYNPPFIKRPPDIVYSEGTTGHTILWEILEANPYTYSLYRDGALIDSGPVVEKNFTISIDGLSIGLHTYLLMVEDESGLSHTASCYVAVVDIAAPTLSQVSDCRFVEGDMNARVVWKAYDLNPSSYTLKRTGTAIKSQETWTGGDITLQLVGWAAGTYNVELIISDTSGNIASDEVTIKIVSEEPHFTSKRPAPISAPGFTFLVVLLVIALIPLIKRLKKHE